LSASAPVARPGLKEDDLWFLDHAKNIPSALMNGASAGWDMACRILGNCRFGAQIDREFGDMVYSDEEGSNWTGTKLFTYVRYDPDVTAKGLNDLDLADIKPAHVQIMDSVDHIDDIQRVGKAYADRYFQLSHLCSFV
jgi:hypothetical protein